MTIRAVVWDVDDTLFDYTGADRAAMREHLLAEGLADGPAGLTEALERWREATELHWARFSAGARSPSRASAWTASDCSWGGS